MFNHANIQALVAEGKLSEAADELSRYIIADEGAHNDAEVWFMRGKINWQLGKRREAMNDYRRAVAIDPDSPAATALEQAYRIMEFFNPDIFNP